MQPVTIVEDRPLPSKYSDNFNVCAAISTSVILIVAATGAAVCGSIVYIPLGGAYPPDVYQIIAFIECGVYLLTALIGLVTISKLKCTIVLYMIACILSSLVSLGGLGWISYNIHVLAMLELFSDCEGLCLYVVISVCMLAFISVAGFITTLIGSIYCCKGVCCHSRKGSSSVMEDPNQAPAANVIF